MAEFCTILNKDISNANLSTKISITEAVFLIHLFERGNDAQRGFQIKEFFSPQSENYIGDLPNMAHKIAGHSYKTDGNIYDSKLLWTLGNYSRFIRPRAKRIDVKTVQKENIKTSAYKNENAEFAIIVINKGETSEAIQFQLENILTILAKRYETSKNNSLTFLGNENISKSIAIL